MAHIPAGVCRRHPKPTAKRTYMPIDAHRPLDPATELQVSAQRTRMLPQRLAAGDARRDVRSKRPALRAPSPPVTVYELCAYASELTPPILCKSPRPRDHRVPVARGARADAVDAIPPTAHGDGARWNRALTAVSGLHPYDRSLVACNPREVYSFEPSLSFHGISLVLARLNSCPCRRIGAGGVGSWVMTRLVLLPARHARLRGQTCQLPRPPP